jgi:putative transcriptional regulator
MKCKLKVIFAERGLKQGHIAKKIGVSQTTLSLIMNNKTVPTLPVAMRIAKELDMRIEDIWQDPSN